MNVREDVIGTAEAAQLLGISLHRVRALIAADRLPARKLGRDWVIARADLALVAERRPGRPRRLARERES
jgi:excisionase family DNA binding protein